MMDPRADLVLTLGPVMGKLHRGDYGPPTGQAWIIYRGGLYTIRPSDQAADAILALLRGWTHALVLLHAPDTSVPMAQRGVEHYWVWPPPDDELGVRDAWRKVSEGLHGGPVGVF